MGLVNIFNNNFFLRYFLPLRGQVEHGLPAGGGGRAVGAPVAPGSPPTAMSDLSDVLKHILAQDEPSTTVFALLRFKAHRLVARVQRALVPPAVHRLWHMDGGWRILPRWYASFVLCYVAELLARGSVTVHSELHLDFWEDSPSFALSTSAFLDSQRWGYLLVKYPHCELSAMSDKYAEKKLD